MAVIGLDLGATKLSGAIFSISGNLTGYSSVSLDKRTGKDVGLLITEFTTELIRKAREEAIEIEAIGCCVPGIVHHDTGTVWAPNIPGWEDFPLKDLLKASFQSNDIYIGLDNDRACSIMGEVWQGAARGCKNAVFLAVGTGIGAGILADGHLIRGKSDIAGAIGWLALNQPFANKYTSVGCFEYHASGDGLARVASEYIRFERDYNGLLKNTNANDMTAHHIFNAYEGGDPMAVKVISEAIVYWGMAVANLVSLFNPEKIIFGGGVFGPAAKFMDGIMKEARKWSQPISISEVKLEVSALGNNAGLFGSAWIALSGKNNPV